MNKKTTVLTVGGVMAAVSLFQVYHLPFLPHSKRMAQGTIITDAHAAEAEILSEIQNAQQSYTCPMHPHVISDEPGQCLICGMDLVATEHDHNRQDKSDRKVLYWYDPMVPGKKFDKPGKSPFMDMELVPKYADETDGDASVVSVSAGHLQKMGVRTEKAEESLLGGGIRATGIITENERTRWDIFSQVEGRVDDLKYSAPGDRVKKGDLFYTLYSPELLALQNDYIAAVKAGYDNLAASAKKRMELLGVDGKVLSRLEKTGKAYDSVPFYIPSDGILNRLEIRKGHYVMVNAEIGHIQDLSTVWVEVAIPEKDLGLIKEGDHARITIAGSSAELEATVDYIYPSITPETRTGRIRLVVANPDYLLKPAGYAIVIFADGKQKTLTIPNSAILRDSRGEHVIISLGGGKFQAREVKTGRSSEGRTEIIHGLSHEEEIVTNGQFLIDSESNLRESLQKLSGGK